MTKHADATSVHKGAYPQADDPGAVGAGILWLDLSVGPPFQLKVRNAADDGWQDVGIVAAGGGGGGGGGTLTDEALVASGGTTTASSETTIAGGGSGDQFATNATDDDDGTEWWTHAGATLVGSWLRVDLGSAKPITNFRVVQSANSGYRATSSKIQTSADGSTGWTDQATLASVVDSGVVALAAPVTARYWRLLCTGAPISSFWGIATLSLFSGASEGELSSLVWRGAWGSGTAYVVGDIIESGGSAYICISAHTNHVPPNATYWDLLASRGDDGTDGTSFTWRGAWSSATAYVANDVVSSGGSSYICILGHTNHVPPNSTYWALMADGSGGGGGGGHTIQDEGVDLTDRTGLSFAGDGVALADDPTNDATIVVINRPRAMANPMTDVGDLITASAARSAVNRALSGSGASATASQANGSYPASNAVDANPATQWFSDTTSGDGWLRVDLGAAHPITAFRMLGEATDVVHRFTDYDIESSTDDSAWTVRHSLAGQSAVIDTGIIPLATPANARYWRLHTANMPSGGPSVYALEFYEFAEATIEVVAIGNEDDVLTVVDVGGGVLEPRWAPSTGGGGGGGGGGGSSGLANDFDAVGQLIASETASTLTPRSHSGTGATASASQSNGSYPPSRAIDENPSTQWYSDNTSGDGWLEIDLGAAYDIGAFRMMDEPSSSTNRFNNYTIESSTDDSSWTTRHTMTGQSGVSDSGVVPLTTPATAQFWRIHTTSMPSGGPAVYLLDFYEYTAAAVETIDIGDEGDVLTVTDVGGGVLRPRWAAGGGGGGGGSASHLGVAITAPPTTGWSWVNQGSAAIARISDAEVLSAASAGGDDFHLRARSLSGGSNFDLRALIATSYVPTNYVSAGIFLRDGSGGAVYYLGFQSAAESLVVWKYSDYNSFGSVPYGAYIGPRIPVWLRFLDDGTNLLAQWSLDGRSWVTAFSEAHHTWLTATQAGIFVNPHGGDANLSLISWDVT